MTDPLSLVALGAAVGGATGKFVEKAWDSGERWITNYFLDHRPKAIAQAQANSFDFVQELATRVKLLEEKGSVSKEQIETAQEQPDFSVALQKAMLTAAQTSDSQKHQLLAVILSERLQSKTDSLRALASKMALDVIGYMTPNQLKLLALAADLFCVNPSSPLSREQFIQWFDTRFSVYQELTFTNLDLLHIESISCLKQIAFLSRDLSAILSQKANGNFDQALLASQIGKHIQVLWGQGLQAVDLTSVGQLIGVSTSDLLSGGTTSFSGWD